MPAAAVFDVPGGVGFCNALRRTLLHDVRSTAPCRVTMHTNTSCQTDEFLAHRIGLIPFQRVGNGDTMRLRAEGPGAATAAHFTGPAFDAVHPEIEIMQLGAGHALDLTVHFDEQPAGKHARYSMCAGVGMKVGTDACRLTFSSIDGRPARTHLLEALDHLDARTARALRALAAQPETPPKSFC